MYTGKKINIPVFLHHINIRKRVKIIPNLCEHRIDKKFFHRKLHRFFHRIVVFCEKFTGVSFFVEKFTGWRMIHIFSEHEL